MAVAVWGGRHDEKDSSEGRVALGCKCVARGAMEARQFIQRERSAELLLTKKPMFGVGPEGVAGSCTFVSLMFTLRTLRLLSSLNAVDTHRTRASIRSTTIGERAHQGS